MPAIIATLRADGRSVALNQPGEAGAIWCEAIAGWWGTPEAKVEMVERASGDGAHRVADEAILYASRVVTLELTASGPDRAVVMALMESVNALAHHHVTLEVADARGATRATGYLEVEWAEEAYPGHQRGTATIVCADPRRYGTRRTAFVVPSGAAVGGLSYDADAAYILLPIEFYGQAPEGNSATVGNQGTSTAYPTITVSGRLPGGFVIQHAGGELAYSPPVGAGAPVVLDCLTRTATVRGVDVTRALSRRDFPSIGPGGSITLSVLAEGDATVTIESSDTYI